MSDETVFPTETDVLPFELEQTPPRADDSYWSRLWAYRDAVLVWTGLLLVWSLLSALVSQGPNPLLPSPAATA
ncbi:MAG TPA: hypothetical protein VES89_10110, partial [Candidatus Competibacteraceae bacterium]|nr:hypothetical protein [Candidatus Competibacteraceae bacterium]